MRSLSVVPALLFSVLLYGGAADKPAQGALNYRAVMTFRDGRAPVVSRFVLTPTAVVETRNKVKKPRMGGWRLEAEQRKEDAYPQSAALIRLERLLYFAGPTPELVPKPIYVRYAGRQCQVWQVPVPAGVQAYAYLVEVAPGILALSYYSGGIGDGEIAGVELQLERFQLQPSAAPAEQGTLLLSTLKQLTAASRPSAEGGAEVVPE